MNSVVYIDMKDPEWSIPTEQQYRGLDDHYTVFSLSKDQTTRAELWHHEHVLWKPDCWDARFAYCFANCELGTTEWVECRGCRDSLWLTDYSTW